MKTAKIFLFSACVTTILMLHSTILYSQESLSEISADSTASQEIADTQADTVSAVPVSESVASTGEEIILEEIKIEGINPCCG